MDTKRLKEIGLSNTESKVYLTLLKLGEANVSEISKSSGLHRTNIYDDIEKLKERGLISYVFKGKKQFLRASDPETLISYLKEKEESIAKLIPELKEIQSNISEKVVVEIFKGEKGMENVLKEILIKKEKVIGYSISGQLRKYLPEFSEYYFREQIKHKIIHEFIYTSGVVKPPSRYYQIKYLPKEFENTTINLCYGDVILNLIWEPELVAIKIKSKQLADNFRKHFSLLWKSAKR